MSYNRAYAVGEEVRIDQGVLVGVPTLGPCTLAATVLAASSASVAQVFVIAEGYASLYVYKDRVSP